MCEMIQIDYFGTKLESKRRGWREYIRRAEEGVADQSTFSTHRGTW
jgi:hypothetical protein